MTLLNVQADTSGNPEAIRRESRAVIDRVARQAGIPRNKYRAQVLVTDSVEKSLLKEVKTYDTVCLGASGGTRIFRVWSESLPEIVRARVPATVAIVRSPEGGGRSLFADVVEWFSV